MKHKMFRFGAWNSRQISARMGEVCRHIPLPASGLTWDHQRGGKFLVHCPVSACLLLLHCLCWCRIPKWCLCCAGWETFLSPVHQEEYEASHSTVSGSIQWYRAQDFGFVTTFCANLPKTSSKGPQGCTGNLGSSRVVRQVVSTTDPSFLLFLLADNENQLIQDD